MLSCYSFLKKGSLFHLFSRNCPIAAMIAMQFQGISIFINPACVLAYRFWLEANLSLVLCLCQDQPKAELSQQTLCMCLLFSRYVVFFSAVDFHLLCIYTALSIVKILIQLISSTWAKEMLCNNNHCPLLPFRHFKM